MRKATFKDVPAKLDGQSLASVVIEHEPGHTGIVTIRPKRSRRAYRLSLSIVAEMVAWRVAKLEADRT